MTGPRNLLLVALVVVCGVSLWLGRGGDLPELPFRQAAPPPVEKAGFEDGAGQAPIHLRILNGTGEAGLAGDMALLLPRVGCVVEGVGNATAWAEGPCLLLNRRLEPARAAELGARLGGVPVLREWDGRTTEDAVLVLGADHRQLAERLRAYNPGSHP